MGRLYKNSSKLRYHKTFTKKKKSSSLETLNQYGSSFRMKEYLTITMDVELSSIII